MDEQIRISAKTLGEVALPDFCPRCFWIKLRLRNRLPFQIFPGIFSSIDSYNKRLVHSWFDRHGTPPDWMRPLGDIVAYRDPPHYSKFKTLDQVHEILLTGSPDGVFVCSDDSHVIVDYKTAKYTGTQDELYPMYEAQLNVYARLGNEVGFAPVSALALIYMEPITDDTSAAQDGNHLPNGFLMAFNANVHLVRLDVNLIGPLLARTRELYDMASPPVGNPACKDCPLLAKLTEIASL